MDRTLKVGRCVRGKIAFPVPSKKRPELIVYAPESSMGEAWQWAVS